ncbi:MAG TPA: hypothetical protein VGC89_07205 [Pyrinomonadaceae bacterium]|jgi:hypothetical protein
MELNLTVNTEALIERPLIGLAPWLDAPVSKGRWDKLRVFLEYLNFPAYHFHMTHALYRREIDAYGSIAGSLNDGLAKHFVQTYNTNDDGEFVGLIRAMQFAHEQKASLHMITARPVNPYPTTNAFATPFNDYMRPFSIRAYISYMAEFIRYVQQNLHLPIQIVNLIDEPRWFFLHAGNPPDPSNTSNPVAGTYYGLISPAELKALYPSTWDFAYTFLNDQLNARGVRSGVNIQMLSDVYPYGNLANDVAHLLTSPAVTSAANGICFVNYGGPDEANTIIGKARADMAQPGAANPRIFFKDMGGTRVENATAEDEFAYGLDSIAGAMRAFRQGVDFCAQYFFVRADVPQPHARMFAASWNGTDYVARRPLAPLALFSKTQARGAYRMKDQAGAGVPDVDYLTLLSNRGTANDYYTYYLVNRSKEAHTVNLRPARNRPLYLYWLAYGLDHGYTIQSQPLASAATVRAQLPPRSMTAITEQPVANLNWPIREGQ